MSIKQIKLLVAGIIIAVVALTAVLMFSNTKHVAQAHKGRRFESTGFFVAYAGTTGFVGPVLDPGTYFTGKYGDIRSVQCGQQTPKEVLKALTKDGVQFSLDVRVRYSANCADDESVKRILSVLSPDPNTMTVTAPQLYSTYLRPALGKSLREAVGPYDANAINANRVALFKKIETAFLLAIEKQQPQMVRVFELNIGNLDFPDKLEAANLSRAEQSIKKDEAIAARERVKAETETANERMALAQSEAANEAARITLIGQALKENPAFLQYQLQQQMPGIYKAAGEGGNLVIAAPSPTLLVTSKGKKK